MFSPADDQAGITKNCPSTLDYIRRYVTLPRQRRRVSSGWKFFVFLLSCLKPPWPPHWLAVCCVASQLIPELPRCRLGLKLSLDILCGRHSNTPTLQHSPGLTCQLVPGRTDCSLADWASIRNIQILIGRPALPAPLLASWGSVFVLLSSTLSTSFVQLALRSFYWAERGEKQTERGVE